MGNRYNLSPHATKVYTAATTYPVTASELKVYLRETGSTDDDLLADIIIQATSELEIATRRSFINATYDDVYDYWPLGDDFSAVVHRNPLSSVTSITYYDIDNLSQTFSSANYVVDTTSEPGRIRLAENVTLPQLYDRNNAVTIRYVAGYGATAASTPKLAKHWIYLWAGAAFCRRPLLDEEMRSLRSIETVLSYGL